MRRRLRDTDAGVRFQASTALGRLGDAAAIPALIEALDEPDAFARYAAFTALNRIGRRDPAAWGAIVLGLSHAKPTVRDGVTMALRETYEPTLVQTLVKLARDPRGLAPAKVEARPATAGQRPPTPTSLEGGVVGVPPGPHAPTGQDRALGGNASRR